MTLNDLLDVAIQLEIKSQKLYAGLLDVVTDKDARAFLSGLVEEEKRHEATLLMVKEMELYDGSLTVNEAVIHYAVPAAQEARRVIDSTSTIEDILAVALEREFRAHRIFTALAAAFGHPELKRLFSSLAEEETQHHANIRKRFGIQQGELGFEM